MTNKDGSHVQQRKMMVGNIHGWDYFGDLQADGRMIIKLIQRNWLWSVNWVRLSPVVGFCEHGNHPFGSIKKGNFLTSLISINCTEKILYHLVCGKTLQYHCAWICAQHLTHVHLIHQYVIPSHQFALYYSAEGNKTHDWDILIFTQHWPLTVCLQWKESLPQHSCILRNIWTVHGIWWDMSLYDS